MLARAGSRTKILWTRTLTTPASLAESARLQLVHEAVVEAISAHALSALAIERLMWGKNVGSAMKVSRASGVILLAAEQAGIPVEEYAPLEVKMAVTGVGNAGKDQVRLMLKRAHRIEDLPTQPDAADAVAIAFCHMQQSRSRALERGAAAR